MSHFSVIVATKDFPSEDVLKRELQPFHEFECTGTDDQYVQEIDVTEQYRKDYESGTRMRFQDECGKYHDPYEERFYREPTDDESKKIGMGTGFNGGVFYSSRDWGDGKGYRPKIHFCPPNMKEVEVRYEELISFASYVEEDGKCHVAYGCWPDLREKHKYGYALLGKSGTVIQVVDRTNPNSKWDYWRIGGRYCRKFIPKPGSDGACAQLSYEWQYEDRSPPEGVDIVRKRDLDIAKMKQARVQDRVQQIEEIASRSKLTHDQVDAGIADYWKFHAVWMELPEPKPRGGEFKTWLAERNEVAASVWSACYFDIPEVNGMTVTEWCTSAPYLTGFAFLREGKWAQEGEMGWFACVSGRNDKWPEQFQTLVDDVPDDYWLTVVDCHI
jgi:hypothetical protein